MKLEIVEAIAHKRSNGSRGVERERNIGYKTGTVGKKAIVVRCRLSRIGEPLLFFLNSKMPIKCLDGLCDVVKRIDTVTTWRKEGR